MRVTQMVTDGENRLHGSLTSAVSLEFALLFAGFLSFLFPEFLSAVLRMTGWLPEPSPVFSFIEPSVLLILLLLFQNPLLLGITGWYQRVEGGYVHPREAFFPFAGPGAYFRAVWFGVVRSAAVFLFWFMPLLPAMILGAVLHAGMQDGSIEGGIFAWLIVLFFLLALLGALFAVYLNMGFFFADYYYVRGMTNSPFKALAASQKTMYGNRFRFVKVLFCALPYFLLCLLIAPVPFAAANIRSILAVFANAEMEASQE